MFTTEKHKFYTSLTTLYYVEHQEQSYYSKFDLGILLAHIFHTRKLEEFYWL